MSVKRKKQVVLLLLVVVIAGLLSIFGTAAADPPVTPPPPEELAIEWWQWAAGLPADHFHPLIKSGYADCSLGQEGDVWFLGGTYSASGKATRVCDVPADTYLFFPIVNIICSPFTGDVESTDPLMTFDEFLLACAVNPGDVYGFDLDMYPVSASVDGVEIPNLLDSYVVPGETFLLGPVADPNIFGAEAGAEELAATTGYYLLLPPLPEGKHKIEFIGKIDIFEEPYFTTDLTYILFVE